MAAQAVFKTSVRLAYARMICIVLVFTVQSAAYSQTLHWAKQLGSDTWDEGIAITTDGNGNVYTIGNFDDTLDLDPGPGKFNLFPKGRNDVFICKLNALGNFVWAKQIGGIGSANCTDIAVDRNGNVHITGWFLGITDFDPGPGTFNITSSPSTDAFICKLDASGNFLWAIKFAEGPSSQIFPYPVYSNSIAVDNNGNVYTTGSFDGKTDFDPGPGTYYLTPAVLSSTYTTDIFISKLNSSGNFVWVKQLSGTAFEGGQALALDASGNIYTTGFFNGTVDFDPGPDSFNLSTSGYMETVTYISKLDASGNFAWAKKLGGTQAHGLAVDNAGNAYVGGSGYHALNGITIQKFSPTGDNLWAKEIMVYWCTSLAVDNEHNVYTTGAFSGTKDFDPGPGTFTLSGGSQGSSFISKLDSAGKFVWAQQLSGTAQTQIQSIAVDRNKNIYTTGYFNQTADFDLAATTFNLAAVGSYDAFILKLRPDKVGSGGGLNDFVTIYPNPTRGRLVIEFRNGFNCSYIVLRNMLGQLMAKKLVNSTDPIEMVIKAASGVYILELYAQNGERIVERIVKIDH